MGFRYVIQTLNKNGSKESSVQDIEKDEVLIGRGTSSDILLLGKLVSLNHAQLSVQPDGLLIQDLDSLSGVFVNDTLISKSALKPEDRVKIGSWTFTVFFQDGVWGFFEQRSDQEEEEETEVIIEGQEKKLRFQSYIPSMTLLSSFLTVGILLYYFAAPLGTGHNTNSWNTGPISNSHKMIEADCAQCHSEGFTRVQDKECLSCHSLSDHSPTMEGLFENHPQMNFRCATCHMEHNGDLGLIAQDSKLCTDCHGQIANLLPASTLPPIDSFAEHPEFRVTVSADAEVKEKISLGNSELRDPSQIKLNHKIHLEPDLAGRDGLVTLGCMDCHELDKEQNLIKPISFEAHCADCHSLEFDERLAGASVPHGKAEVVYNYLFAEYAKLFLEKEGVEDPSTRNRRRKPGQAVKRGAEITFTRSSVVEQARETEDALFNRTACHLCHMVTELPEPGPAGNKFEVVKPNIPDNWMPDAVFDHGAHQEVTCESCHAASQSVETSDVLLPGKENCFQCHDQHGSEGFVRSDCVMCHSYHDTLILDDERKREIEAILISLEQKIGQQKTSKKTS